MTLLFFLKPSLVMGAYDANNDYEAIKRKKKELRKRRRRREEKLLMRLLLDDK